MRNLNFSVAMPLAASFVVTAASGVRAAPQFVPRVVATDTLSQCVAIGDMNGDGHPDLVASLIESGVRVFRSTGGVSPSFVPSTEITSERSTYLVVADIDSDGDLDIASSVYFGSSMTVWYENLGGSPLAFARHEIPFVGQSAHLAVGDLNLDGWPDIVTAASDGVQGIGVVVQISDGNSPPAFASMSFGAPTNRHCIEVADIDRDGDLDIFADNGNVGHNVEWFENRLRSGEGFVPHVIPASFPGIHSTMAADLDLDGDIDFAVGSNFTLQATSWIENVGGSPLAFVPHLVSGFDVESLWIEDVDCDGDPDIVSAESDDNTVSIYRNERATPDRFAHVSVGVENQSIFVTVGDLNHDGKMDLVTTSQLDRTIRWYEQVDCVGDVDGNGGVDFGDITGVLANFGVMCH